MFYIGPRSTAGRARSHGTWQMTNDKFSYIWIFFVLYSFIYMYIIY